MHAEGFLVFAALYLANFTLDNVTQWLLWSNKLAGVEELKTDAMAYIVDHYKQFAETRPSDLGSIASSDAKLATDLMLAVAETLP